ncbi:hypothetical protein ACU77B_000281 [Escherichia coli]|uniref:hypothetical protein n=1 Tax=Escherichia coli TaxID=562 RepID=UPI000411D7DB|nr:hypothetical protein [Escherichia coli]MCN5069098.1 hypothetical protein [Escherichia coli]MCN5631833.1 hypothetical protein [Escherichia coli]MCV1765662.1 hypothetical protein [Escherichia coli]
MKEILTDRTERACRFYIEYMKRKIEGYRDRTPLIIIADYKNQDVMDMILKELNNEFKSTHDYNNFVREMKNGLKSSIIPEANFKWIKDYSSAYFAWNVLSTMGPQEVNSLEVDFNRNLKPLIKQNLIPVIPENQKKALSAIYDCFDNWDVNLLFKTKTLSSLKNIWIQRNRELPEPFKWIDLKNLKQCEWAFKYVMEHIKPDYIPSFMTEIRQEQVITFLTAVLYSWPAHPDTRRLMIQRMKKTYNQNVFRENITGKKVINTYVQKDIKEKLDMLAKKNGRKINEELEVIIMNAWHAARYAEDK